MKTILTFGIAILCFVHIGYAQPDVERVDTSAMAKIIDEGMNRSQIMETLSYLTDVYGPRLTASPEYKQAADWAKKRLESYGVQNVHFDGWGPFGRGWTLKRFAANAIEPRTYPIIGYPKAWSPGTRGRVKAPVVHLDAKTEADLNSYKGKLKGAIVLLGELRNVEANFQPLGSRLTPSELLGMANAPMPRAGGFGRDSLALRRMMERNRFLSQRLEFCMNEGAVALFETAAKGDGGTVFVGGAAVPQAPDATFERRANPYDEKIKTLPQVVLTPEHYNRMLRMMQKGQKVQVELELDVEFTGVQEGFNVIGEIPGSDLKDEIVMIGAHFDSWHAGTGATDNATGSAVCMEAMRILKAIGLPLRRTVRIGLWGGEEQGLIGSRMYVSKYFGEREGGRFNPTGPVKTKSDHEKFSVYFNNDNGTGMVRGVYMQGNEAARPIFRAWLAPFEKFNASTLTLQNTGGTDHLSFDAVGLPGFQFIQDPIEYDTRTHHSNMDTYERVQEADVKQAAIIMAAFAYNAATRDGKFPRKPLPMQVQAGSSSGGR
ncbi:MAG TPA: M28 family peptidase [Bacteroidota bacterium]|nr:M28 family peptidase [Bacteroidota bacterium]